MFSYFTMSIGYSRGTLDRVSKRLKKGENELLICMY